MRCISSLRFDANFHLASTSPSGRHLCEAFFWPCGKGFSITVCVICHVFLTCTATWLFKELLTELTILEVGLNPLALHDRLACEDIGLFFQCCFVSSMGS